MTHKGTAPVSCPPISLTVFGSFVTDRFYCETLAAVNKAFIVLAAMMFHLDGLTVEQIGRSTLNNTIIKILEIILRTDSCRSLAECLSSLEGGVWSDPTSVETPTT